jgi:hypothetical protein
MLSEGSGCGGLEVRLRLPLLVLLVCWIRSAVWRERNNPARKPAKNPASKPTNPKPSKKTQTRIQSFPPPHPPPDDPSTTPAANSLPHPPHQEQQRPSLDSQSSSSQEDEEEEKGGQEEDRLEHDSTDPRHRYQDEGPLVSSHPEEVGDEVDEDFNVDSKEVDYPESGSESDSETEESRRSDD